jgi:glutamyl-tRNA synthetase
MILGPDKKRLSKRHGATSVMEYQKQGYLPEAMLNFLALLGWSPGNDIEVMTVAQMIEHFSTDGLSKNAAIFDMKKLEWMNGQHLGMMSADELRPLVSRGLVAAGLATDAELASRADWLASLIELLKVRARTVDDIVRQARPYFGEAVDYDEEAVAKQWKDKDAARELLQASHDALSADTHWTLKSTEDALRGLAEARGIAPGKIFQPLRVALTGLAASPGIFDVLVVLGRDRSLARIAGAVRRLAAS